jgi:DNA ligase-1
MNRFAALLDRLAYEPGRNAKLRLLADYFRSAPDPDRGYALAAMTGALSFRHAKPNIIRALIAERTDPVLFEMSYDYVGDLSETVALMWPSHGHGASFPLRAGEREASEASRVRGALSIGSESPSPRPSPLRGEGAQEPRTLSLAEVVTTISALCKTVLK